MDDAERLRVLLYQFFWAETDRARERLDQAKKAWQRKQDPENITALLDWLRRSYELAYLNDLSGVVYDFLRMKGADLQSVHFEQ